MCERVDIRTVNRKVLECLIKAGACDSLGANRATLWSQIDSAIGLASAIAADRARGQVSFFDALEAAPKKGKAAKPEVVVELPEWPTSERLAHEKELLGFYVSGHPLQPYERLLQRYTLHAIEDLASLPNRSMARVGGLVAAVQQGVSKKSGKPYAMVTLEDLTGTVTLLAMNESYDKFRELFVANLPLLVVGEVSTGEDKPKIFPTDILRLDDAPRRLTKQVQLRIPSATATPERLQSVRGILETHAGRLPFYLCIQMPTGVSIFIEPSDRYTVAASVELETALESVCGNGTVFMSADKSLPERQLRKWEKKSDSGGGDE
jgi:DNA polymerase-3 subunit alpha